MPPLRAYDPSRGPVLTLTAQTAGMSPGRATMTDMARIGSSVPLLGRSTELRDLRAAVERSAAGEPSVVLLAGDAGVGKTRLLSELVDGARDGTDIVLIGHCIDLGELAPPYLPFAEITADLQRRTERDEQLAEVIGRHTGVARLLAGGPGPEAGSHEPPGAPEPAPGQRQVFDSLSALVQDLCRLRPVLLVIEDLHWADRATRDLLRFLISRSSGQRLAIVASYRSDDLHRRHPLRPWLGDLARLPMVDRLTLEPLSDSVVAELVQSIELVRAIEPRTVPDRVLRGIVSRAEGNAFYAEELAAAVGTGGVPDTLNSILLTRLEALPAAAQHVVRVASVAGRSVSHELLAEIAGQSATELDLALREAVNRYLLVAAPDGTYQFRHALLREAAYADLLPGERVRIHAAYAEALTEGGSSAELARHYRESNDLAGGIRSSWRAATDAARLGAPAEQLQHLETVLRLWSAVPDAQELLDQPHAEVAMAASLAASAAGEQSRAVKLGREALESLAADADPDLVSRVRFTFARHLVDVDADTDAYDNSRAALDVLGPEPTSATWAWAAATHMRICFFLDRFEEAAEIGRRGLAAAEEFGADAARVDLLISTARLREFRPDGGAESIEALVEAHRMARSSGEYVTEQRASYNLAMAQLTDGNLAGALDVLRAANARAQELGQPYATYSSEALGLTVYVCSIAGEWDEAQEIIAGCRDNGPESTRRVVATGLGIDIARGIDVTEELRRIRPWASAPIVAIIFGIASAELAWQTDDPAGTIEAFEDTLERVTPYWGADFLAQVRLAAIVTAAHADRAETLRLGGDESGVAEILGQVQPILDRAREVIASGRAFRGGASLGFEADAWVVRLAAEEARLAGRSDVDLWRESVRAFGFGARYEQARSRLRLTEELLGAGDRAAAKSEATAAYEVARALRARPLVAALEALARRGRLEIGAPEAARSDGVGLTPRESEVLALLARGLTNRQIGAELFISEKTASVHVSNILGKLTASGRTEAVAIAHRRGLIAAGG